MNKKAKQILFVCLIMLAFLAGILIIRTKIKKATYQRELAVQQYIQDTLSLFEDIRSYEITDDRLQLTVDRESWKELSANEKSDRLISLQVQITKKRNEQFPNHVDYYPISIADPDHISLAQIDRYGNVSISF